MHKQRGYNLVELMIVVAIIGIIAAIAYPSYTESVRKSRRAECAGGLTSLGSAMERYYSVNNTYEGAADGGKDTGDPEVFTPTCPVDGGTATYDLTISAATASTYTVQAAPTGAQTKDKCGTLTLNNRGGKGISGAATGLTAQDCW